VTLPQIEKDYIETGKVKYVMLDYPIESIHKQAFKAHEAANCSGEQGKYWEMHAQIFANRKAMSLDDLKQHSIAIGLDQQKFQQCLESGKYTAEIRNDMAEGGKAGVRGTPTFFLGLTGTDDSKVKATKMLRGAVAYSNFKTAIDDLLSSQKK
jgi:protein-disulfide isomerase